MKTIGKFLVAVSLFQILFLLNSKAQDFVVTTKGDTLTGELKLFTLGPDKKVVVKGKEKIVVPILQTRIVQFKGDTFKPVRSPRGYQYMKVIKSGYLSLFGYQGENQSSFDSQFLQKLDGSSLDVPNLSFRKMMVNYLSDCPAISTKIDNGDLGKSDLLTIVEEYNACIQQKTEQLVTTKPTSEESSSASIILKKWTDFEERMNTAEPFEGKEEAQEMIREVQLKLRRGEKVPKFIVEGLKNSLSETTYHEDLLKLMQESGF